MQEVLELTWRGPAIPSMVPHQPRMIYPERLPLAGVYLWTVEGEGKFIPFDVGQSICARDGRVPQWVTNLRYCRQITVYDPERLRSGERPFEVDGPSTKESHKFGEAIRFFGLGLEETDLWKSLGEDRTAKMRLCERLEYEVAKEIGDHPDGKISWYATDRSFRPWTEADGRRIEVRVNIGTEIVAGLGQWTLHI